MTAPNGRQPLYSITEVAKISGFSYQTIWGWVNTGELVSTKIRGRHRITAAELERLGLLEPINSG